MQKHKSFEEIFRKKGIVICRRQDREKTSQAARMGEADSVVSAAWDPTGREHRLALCGVRGAESGGGGGGGCIPRLLVCAADTPVSGAKLTRVCISGRGRRCLNPAALRSLFEIIHIFHLLNSLLSIYGLKGGLSEAGGGAYAVSGSTDCPAEIPSCIVWQTTFPDKGQKRLL